MSNRIQVNVTRGITKVVQVNTLGPKGDTGAIGPQPNPGSITGSLHLTGSLIVSSSNLTIDNSGGISGSSVSTGSFGRVEAAGVVFADQFQSVTGGNTIDFNDDVDISGTLTAGTITGMLSSSAQISSDISGSVTSLSSSLASRIGSGGGGTADFSSVGEDIIPDGDNTRD